MDQGGSGRLSNILLALHWAVKRHVANPGAKSIIKYENCINLCIQLLIYFQYSLSLAAEFHLPTNQAIEQAIELGVHFSIAGMYNNFLFNHTRHLMLKMFNHVSW